VINGGGATTSSVSVTLAISGDDPESGVVMMRFSNDGSSWSGWEYYDFSKSWNLTSGDGIKAVYVQFRNGDGLMSIFSDTITLQSVIPEFPATAVLALFLMLASALVSGFRGKLKLGNHGS